MIKSLKQDLLNGKVPCWAEYKRYLIEVVKDENGELRVDFTSFDDDYPMHSVRYYVGDNYERIAERASEIAKDAQEIVRGLY